MATAVKESADPGRGASERRLPAGYPNRRARIAGTCFTGIWLLYLIGPLVDLFTQHYSALDRWTGSAIIVAFCAVYVVAVPNWPYSPWFGLPSVAALAALAAAGCLLPGLGMTGLWIFVSSASGLLVPSYRWAARTVLAFSFCYIVFCVTQHVGNAVMYGDLLPVVFLGLAMIGLRRQFQLTAELTRAREEVAHLAANEERLRLARDMHDLTGQSLSMITLKSELAARLLGRLPEGADRDRVRDEIEQVAAVSRQTLHDIREAISGYRRPTLAVEIITARAALTSAGIEPHDDADVTLLSGTFGQGAEATLAWCLREAVTNVIRHSGAKNCRISLSRHGENVSLTVRDDGGGHAPGDDCGNQPGTGGSSPQPAGGPARDAQFPGGQAPGSGLRGMSERLSAVGGSLELRPDARPGFCLVATVPAK